MSDPVQAARQAADELEGLDAAMTPGEWHDDGLRGGLVNVWVPSTREHICVVGDCRTGKWAEVLADAVGIAALRNRAASDAKLLRSLADDVARLELELGAADHHARDLSECLAAATRERDRLRAACELTLRWLRGEVIERSVRDAIAEALALPGDGAAGGGRG
jgi:hypothetical protein